LLLQLVLRDLLFSAKFSLCRLRASLT
jgi:hypothetical protein